MNVKTVKLTRLVKLCVVHVSLQCHDIVHGIVPPFNQSSISWPPNTPNKAGYIRSALCRGGMGAVGFAVPRGLFRYPTELLNNVIEAVHGSLLIKRDFLSYNAIVIRVAWRYNIVTSYFRPYWIEYIEV